MNFKSLSIAGLAAGTICMLSCGDASRANAESSDTTAAAATPEDTATANSEWVSLFDGKTFNGWHAFNKTDEIKNWAIEDNALVCLGAAKDAHGGDIVTDKAYGNFELEWDWKVTKGANSGVMYHVIEDKKYQAPYETGPEYQVIDDKDFPEKLEE